jgi:hypothetical protein
MSATLAQSGRARAALYISVPLAALGAFGYFAWSSRSRPSAPPVETRQWGQGTVLPVTQSAPIPAAASPQPAPAPVKEVAQAEPVVAPPPRIRVMSVYEQKEGMAEVNQRAAERYAERMKPRTAAPSAAAADDPNVLTPGGSSEYAQRMRSTDFADTMPTPPKPAAAIHHQKELSHSLPARQPAQLGNGGSDHLHHDAGGPQYGRQQHPPTGRNRGAWHDRAGP